MCLDGKCDFQWRHLLVMAMIHEALRRSEACRISHVVYLVVVSRTELRPRFRRVIGATSATGGNKLRHTECRGCVSVGTGDFDSLLKVSLSLY